MTNSWLTWIRRHALGDERKRVNAATKAHWQQTHIKEPEQRFLQTLAKHTPANAPSFMVGRMASSQTPVVLAKSELTGMHMWVTGSTGSGKSAGTLAWELQLLDPSKPTLPLIHLDLKSESSGWFTDIFLPATLPDWPRAARRTFLSSLRVVNPFDGQNLPALNVLAPQPKTPPALQAKEIATLIGEALGSRHRQFGARMTTILSFALRLALAVGGLSLLEVKSLLINPNYLNGLLPFCQDQDIKDYFVYRFSKESKDSVNAVVSRLDLLLLVPDTARVLCARDCLQFDARLERGMTIIDLGGPPRGAEYLSSFWMGVLIRLLARAILARPLTSQSMPVSIVADEWWVAMDEELASAFERLLTLARHKKVGLWLINQLPSQIARYPQLLAAVKQSVGVQIAFRQSHDDAKHLAHMLPTGGGYVLRTQDSPTWDVRRAKPEEEKRRLVNEMSRLPDRSFWFYYKRRGLEAVHLTTPTVNFAGAKQAAKAADPALRQACLGRVGGSTRQQLDQVLATRRAHIALVASGQATSPSPSWQPTQTASVRTSSQKSSRPRIITPRPSNSSQLQPSRPQRQGGRPVSVQKKQQRTAGPVRLSPRSLSQVPVKKKTVAVPVASSTPTRISTHSKQTAKATKTAMATPRRVVPKRTALKQTVEPSPPKQKKAKMKNLSPKVTKRSKAATTSKDDDDDMPFLG